MNSIMLQRMLWKECRQLAPVGAGVGAIALMLMVLIGLMARMPADRVVAFSAIASFIPGVFLLAALSVQFAGERDDGTDQFLCRLAIPPRWMMGVKLVVANSFAVVLVALLAAIATVARLNLQLPGAMVNGTLENQHFAGFAWYMAVLGWGLFFSIVFQRVMTSIVVTLLSSGLTPVLVMAFEQAFKGENSAWSMNHWDTFDSLMRLVILPATLIAVSFVLVERWEARRWPSWLERWLKLGQRGADWFDAGEVTSRSAASVLLRRVLALRWGEGWQPLGSREFGRLMWLEWRGARRWATAWLGLSILMAATTHAVQPDTQGSMGDLYIRFVVLMACVLMGICAYLGEQRGGQFRLLAAQGASPWWVAITKHGVWLVVTVGVVLIGTASYANVARSIRWSQVPGSSIHQVAGHTTWDVLLSQFGVLIVAPTIPGGLGENQPFLRLHLVARAMFVAWFYFSIGNCLGLMFSRTVIAVFAGLFAGGVATAWLHYTSFQDIPISISVMPWFLGLWAINAVRVRDWLVERNRWRHWLLAWTPGVLLCCSGVAGAFCYRAYEWPDLSQHPDIVRLATSENPRHETSDARQTAFEWAQLGNESHAFLWGSVQKVPKPGDDRIDHAELVTLFADQSASSRDWRKTLAELPDFITDLQALADRAYELAHRPACSRLSGSHGSHVREVEGFPALLMASAVLGVDRGELDRADRELRPQVAGARQLDRHGGQEEFRLAMQLRLQAFPIFTRWIMSARQKPEVLKAILSGPGDAHRHPLAIELDQRRVRMRFVEMAGVDYREFTSDRGFEEVAPWFEKQPWEFTRYRRFLDQRMLQALWILTEDDIRSSTVSQGLFEMKDREERARIVMSPLSWMYSPDWLIQFRTQQAKVAQLAAGNRLACAIRLFQLEKGELPERLEDVFQSYQELRVWGRAELQPFQYRPKGIPEVLKSGTTTVRENTPLLWSSGRRGAELPLLPISSTWGMTDTIARTEKADELDQKVVTWDSGVNLDFITIALAPEPE